MSWVKLDDQMLTHPKIAAVGGLGFAVHVAGIVYCGQHLTDGFIRRTAVQQLLNLSSVGLVDGHSGDDATVIGIIEKGTPGFESLEEAGLWRWDEERCGWCIENFLDYNPSRADVEKQREQRAEAGRRGGQKSRPKASAQADAKQALEQSGSESEAEANPVPGPVPDETDVLKGLPPVTEGRFGVGSPQGQKSLQDHWRQAWIDAHAGMSPPTGWIVRLGDQFEGLAEVPYADMELIVGWMGREGKDPKHLPLVVSDFYKDRQRGAV